MRGRVQQGDGSTQRLGVTPGRCGLRRQRYELQLARRHWGVRDRAVSTDRVPHSGVAAGGTVILLIFSSILKRLLKGEGGAVE